MDRQTGHVSIEDPRLENLPDAWMRKNYELEEMWTWFVNKETGEEMADSDLRLTTEELKKKRVDLRMYSLKYTCYELLRTGTTRVWGAIG